MFLHSDWNCYIYEYIHIDSITFHFMWSLHLCIMWLFCWSVLRSVSSTCLNTALFVLPVLMTYFCSSILSAFVYKELPFCIFHSLSLCYWGWWHWPPKRLKIYYICRTVGIFWTTDPFLPDESLSQHLRCLGAVQRVAYNIRPHPSIPVSYLIVINT